jgi:predicted kinase
MDDYELLEAENERIFQSVIATILLNNVAQGIDKPKLILLGGQPGSGKTRSLVPGAENDLAASGRPMLIDADQLREIHPRWKEAILTDDVTAAVKTHPDARKWVRKAYALAIESRCNVILDGTMASPESIAQVIKEFDDAGYDIEARILAIDSRTSWLGVLYRYEQKKSKGQDARMTPREVHDDAVNGIPKTLAAIEADARV